MGCPLTKDRYEWIRDEAYERNRLFTFRRPIWLDFTAAGLVVLLLVRNIMVGS